MRKIIISVSNQNKHIKQSLSLLVAAAFSLTYLGGSLSALAVSEVQPTCDEAYYATLDYYGALQEGSVVKSYMMNGATAIRDYGTYDEVVNLTDNTLPTVSDDSLTFDFGGSAPDRFYFEGKGSAPFYSLPWSIGISYRLNGVTVQAEDLAGKQGLVEINADVLPREGASEYSRDNCVLQAVAVFNADDILSLEAPGAQVQLLGNLKTVLFMALPGEEQHFSIRVGSDDFSFAGMTFLIVPATLSQLDQIADLRETKEKTQNSYDTISSSLDTILDTLDGMDGSLKKTADGLDRLNSARATVSEGKGQVYQDVDASVAALTDLSDALTPMEGHLTKLQQELTDTTDILTKLTDNAVSLKEETESARKAIANIQTNTEDLSDMIDDLESYNMEDYLLTENLQNDVKALNSELSSLHDSLDLMRSALLSMSGTSLSSEAESYHKSYESYLGAYGLSESDLSFTDFLVANGATSDQASSLATLYTVNSMLSGIMTPAYKITVSLEKLCTTLGESGFGGQADDMLTVLSDMSDVFYDNQGLLSTLLDNMNALGDVATQLTKNTDQALDLLKELNNTVNEYIPEAQQALEDVKTATNTTSAGIKNATVLLNDLEALLKESGTDLDSGTKNALDGLSDSLRRSASGLGRTGTIRNAKDAITKLIDDEWDSHTGEDNRVLYMDASAKPVSLTSSQNGAPSSIQVVLRSEEIKVSDQLDAAETSSENATSNGTFFSRIAHMFQDFWNAIKGVFTRG